jgi:predicted DNA binding CopG/RHH family protein
MGDLKIPEFKSEAQESRWWAEHQDSLVGEFERAAAEGRLTRGTVAKRATGVTPTTTIRLPAGDIERAKVQAEQKGLKYQTYLKMLIHEALQAAEKKSS